MFVHCFREKRGALTKRKGLRPSEHFDGLVVLLASFPSATPIAALYSDTERVAIAAPAAGNREMATQAAVDPDLDAVPALTEEQLHQKGTPQVSIIFAVYALISHFLPLRVNIKRRRGRSKANRSILPQARSDATCCPILCPLLVILACSLLNLKSTSSQSNAKSHKLTHFDWLPFVRAI